MSSDNNAQTGYQSKEQPATLLAAMAKHGVTVKAVFVPFSQSRNKSEKNPSLNWRVTLCRRSPVTGQDWDIITTDYMAGSGHCPAYKSKAKLTPYEKRETIVWECENGKKAFYRSWGTCAASPLQKLKPSAADVMRSLLLDSSVLDSGGFESWADEFGYDRDSRNAEWIYKACLDIALKLRVGLGDAVLSDLEEAAQDY